MRAHIARSAPTGHVVRFAYRRVLAAGLLVLAGVASGACADPPAGIRAGSPAAPPPRANLQLLGATGLLYDQASTAIGSLSLSLFDFAILELANDFGVPQGQQWSIRQVVLPGVVPAANPTATQRIAIRADNAGEPGTVIYAGVLAPTGAQAGSPLTSYTYSLPTPVALSAGTYWLGSECDPDVFQCGVGPVVGSASVFTLGCDPDPDVGLCGDGTFTGDGDLAFALYGDAGSDDAADATADLQSILTGFALPAGTSTSLAAKLREVLDAIAAGDTAGACRALNDFINQTRALSGKKLTTAQADALINEANRIRALLGC